MKLLRYLTIFFFLTATIYCQWNFPKNSKFNVDLSGSYSSSSTFFDLTSTQIYTITDSAIKKDYNFEKRAYGFDVALKYKLNNDIILGVEIPAAYYSLTEDYLTDNNIYSPNYGQTVNRGSFSAVVVQNYKIGGRLLLDSGLFSSFVDLDLKIPMKFKNGLQTEASQPLQLYQAYEVLAGYGASFNLGGGWVMASIKYNYRGGDFKDMMQFHFEGSFTTVPNTFLKAYIDMNQSLATFDSTVAVTPRTTSLQENYYSLGMAFHIDFSEKIYSEISYSLRLWGRNTLNLGLVRFNTGFYL